MPEIDFFNFFRYVLGTIVTIYAVVVIAMSMNEWQKLLFQPDRYTSLLRRYLIVTGLRLRFKTFWGDVLICVLLNVVFIILWHAHTRIYQMEAAWNNVSRPVESVHWRGN